MDEEMGEGGPERSPRSPLLCLLQRSGLHGVAQPDSLTHAAGGSVRAPSKVIFQNPTQPAKHLRRRNPTPGRELRENKRKVGVRHPSSLRRTTPAAAPTPLPRRSHAAVFQDSNVMRDVTRAPSLSGFPAPSGAYPEVVFQGGSKRALGELAAAGLGSVGPEFAGKSGPRYRAAPGLPESAPARRGWGPAGLPGQPRRSGSFPPSSSGFCPPLSSRSPSRGRPVLSGLRAENGLYTCSGLQPGQECAPCVCSGLGLTPGSRGAGDESPVWIGTRPGGASPYVVQALAFSVWAPAEGFAADRRDGVTPGALPGPPAALERWVGPSTFIKQCYTFPGQDRPGCWCQAATVTPRAVPPPAFHHVPGAEGCLGRDTGK